MESDDNLINNLLDIQNEYKQFIIDDEAKLLNEAILLIRKYTKPEPRDEVIAAHEEAYKDHQRLVRKIDIIMNGDNAAQQASLCDLIGQIEDREKVIARLREALQWYADMDMKDAMRDSGEYARSALAFADEKVGGK